MDIHRTRFIDYPPPSITALAFSHTSDTSKSAPKDLRLAIGHENGDIALWNPSGGKWVQETILRGKVGESVEGLVWTQEQILEDGVVKPGKLRLFSCGSGVVSEWSLASARKVHSADSNFGQVWCVAAQPAWTLPKTHDGDGDIDAAPSQLLVAGCQTGDIVLFSTSDGELRFQQLLQARSGKKSKVLCLTWRDRNTVVAGYEDGMIRVLDVPKRRIIREMSLGKGPEGSVSVVWSVRCLSDGTIVSGDSSGELKVWDAENFSLVQKLKSHQADVLDIASNAKGTQMFSVGVDRRTVAYELQPAQKGEKRRRWALAKHRRYHDHDAKCAASFEAQGLSVLVSGGMDACPVVLPMRNRSSENHRALPHLPQRAQMSTSRNRLVLAWWETQLSVYEVPKRGQDGEPSFAADDYDLLATMKLKDDDHITSAQISRDGRYAVASTNKGVRLFQLRKSTVDGSSIIRSRVVPLPNALQVYGARHVILSPDCRWLCAVRFDNTVILGKIMSGADVKSLPTIYPKLAKLTPFSDEDDEQPLGTYADQVTTVKMSADSRVLVTGDLAGHITAWTLEGHEDLAAADTTALDKRLELDSASSSSSDSDSDEDEDESPTIHAQRWTRTPEFPRLDSPILALCMRQMPNHTPSSPEKNNSHHSSSPPQSNIALHATRHNPHPLAHESANPNTTVHALTSSHSLTELALSTGKLTTWSRRNPSSLLPARFRIIKDRAIDMFLHGSRLWIYGGGWVYMLDLSVDLPSDKSGGAADGNTDTASSASKKRKRQPDVAQLKGTGAGSRILNHRERDSAVAPTGLKYKGEHGQMEIVDLEGRMKPESDDNEDVSMQDVEALVDLRRNATGREHGKVNGGDLTVAKNQAAESITDYSTFRYRAIFGIGVLSNDKDGLDLPLGDAASNHKDVSVNGTQYVNNDAPDERKAGLEVIIVERPMYEVAQADRFDGGQDWDV